MASTAFLEERITRREIIFLDGATGTELEKRGVPMHGKAWSAASLLTAPEIIRQIHVEYIQAGVDVITANSFSLTRHMLRPAGLEEHFVELNRRAIRLAKEARSESASSPVAIAGSIAPTTFCVDPDMLYPSTEVASAWYREQADLLAEAGAEILCVEMIEDIEQGSLAVQAAVATGLPVWLGFSCKKGADGTVLLWERSHTLQEGVTAISPLGGTAACIMHTEVSLAGEALAILRQHWRGPLGVYAHSGLFIMPHWQFNEVISPEDYAAAAVEWHNQGATILGGCCGIGPEHIRALRRQFQEQI
jgi:homocysteine S-methyltransferase